MRYRNLPDLSFFFFLILGLLSGMSCSKNPPLPLRVQLVHDPVSLDPALAEDGVALQVLNNTLDGLVGYDSEGNLENRLAKSIEGSPDGKRYEVILKENARWSDGREVLAEDFVAAFRRALGPQSISKLSEFFMVIRNARAYHIGKSSPENLGVAADATHRKLIFELEKSVPYFLQTLTLPPALPIRTDILEANQGKWPGQAPSTGSYTIAARKIGQKMSLKKNPYYWRGGPKLPEIDFLVVSDESTGLNLFQQGKLDLLLRVPFLDYSRLKKTGRIQTTPYLTTYYLSFNCRKPPFNNKTWRKAVAGAIHRDQVTELLGAGEMPAWSWIPFGLEGYIPFRDPTKVFSQAVSRAKASSKQLPAITAAFDTGVRNLKIMEKVQQDLQKELGLKISLNELDWKTYLRTLQSDTPQIYRMGWMAPFRDPISHLKVFTTGNLNNHSGFSNSRYDSLVNEIESLPSGAAREDKILRAQKIILEEEAAVVPIYHYVQNTGVSPRVKNFKANSFGLIQFHQLELE